MGYNDGNKHILHEMVEHYHKAHEEARREVPVYLLQFFIIEVFYHEFEVL